MSEMPKSDDAKPWGEAQWEAFMERSEMRAAKYCELLDTVREHPDRDVIISHEMGWDEPEFADEACNEMDPLMVSEMSDAEEAEFAAEQERERAELEELPAYIAAHGFGLKLHKTLKPLAAALYEKLGDAEPDGRDPVDYNLVIALRNCFVPAVRLAGSHGMSYEEDTLGAAIVKCRQSLQAAEATLEALEKLHQLQTTPAAFNDLIEENRCVCTLVAERIAELRSRVWWK